MNDSDVSACPESKAPVNVKSAYILFYCREKGDALHAAIHAGAAAATARSHGSPIANGKRPRESGEGFRSPGAGWTQEPPAKKAFIGPVVPGKAPPVVGTASAAHVSAFKPTPAAGSPSMLTKSYSGKKPTQISTTGNLVNQLRGRQGRPGQGRPGILTS